MLLALGNPGIILNATCHEEQFVKFPWERRLYKKMETGGKSRLKATRRERTFKCGSCDYSCTTFGGLKKHSYTHTGEKPFQCGICDYSYNRAESLKTHSYTHTGEKPYQCDRCDFSFTSARNLKIHSYTHTGEKPHQFAKSNTLKNTCWPTEERKRWNSSPLRVQSCWVKKHLRTFKV